jgi:acyl transferase domain-containing protein
VTSHAFHSPMMDAIVAPYKKVVESVKLNAPRIPIISTVTAEWLKDEEADLFEILERSPARHGALRASREVRMERCRPCDARSGSAHTATTLARQQSSDNKKQAAVPSLGDSAGNGNELTQLLKAVGGLWQSGVLIDWKQILRAEERRSHLHADVCLRARSALGGSRGAWPPGGHAMRARRSKHLCRSVGRNLSPKDRSSSRSRPVGRKLRSWNWLKRARGDLPRDGSRFALPHAGSDLAEQEVRVKISFRQLNEELPNLDKLADHILPHWNAGGVRSCAASRDSGSEAGMTPAVNALEDAPELKKVFGAQARIVKEKVDDMTPATAGMVRCLCEALHARRPPRARPSRRRTASRWPTRAWSPASSRRPRS